MIHYEQTLSLPSCVILINTWKDVEGSNSLSGSTLAYTYIESPGFDFHTRIRCIRIKKTILYILYIYVYFIGEQITFEIVTLQGKFQIHRRIVRVAVFK